VLRKFWLLFAQACTLVIAALFVVSTLRPDLVPRLAGQAAPPTVSVVQGMPTVAAAPVASYADAARAAMPAVVNIYTSKEVGTQNPLADDELFRRYFPDLAKRMAPQRARSLGSGVIVAPEGYVLTNFHVVDGADDITLVLADGREIKATVRGADPESDLAVLKAATGGLPAITLGDLESVRVGDVVLAIGNPFGFGNTVTAGIVSALGRNHLGINRFEDFIQTDAPINPGNSGGALVDTAGHLIGINSTIYSQSGGSLGIGFAIPVSLARNVLSQIIEHGEVTRGWLGVEPADLSDDGARALALDHADGVLIRSLQPNGPADRAGMKVRDVVVDVAGKATHDVAGLLSRIAELSPGSVAKVKVWRAPQVVELDVTVGKRPKAEITP
jgi:serine protease DegQ